MSRQASPTICGSGGIAVFTQHEVRPHLLLGEQRAAHVVDVVGIAVVGGASVMIAFSAGGRRAATCSELKPPQEMPVMPTLPLHQGCAARNAMISHGVLLLARQIFVGEIAIGIAGAAYVDAAIGDAVAGEPGMHVHVARHGAVAAAIGDHLDDDRHLRVGHRTPERGGNS